VAIGLLKSNEDYSGDLWREKRGEFSKVMLAQYIGYDSNRGYWSGGTEDLELAGTSQVPNGKKVKSLHKSAVK
jgi:hypothetical protein